MVFKKISEHVTSLEAIGTHHELYGSWRRSHFERGEKFFHHIGDGAIFDDEGDGIFLGVWKDTDFVVVDREFGVKSILRG